jgi:serine/threonine protein kinase
LVKDENSGELTVCGTPETMAPEMVLGSPYGLKIDVWAIGCVLYQLLALARPFDGVTVHEMLGKICRGAYAPLPKTVDPTLRLIVQVCLSTHTARRPFIQDLADFPAINAAKVRHAKDKLRPREKSVSDMMREGSHVQSSKAKLPGHKTQSKSARDVFAAQALKTSSEKRRKLKRHSTFNSRGSKKSGFFSNFGKRG